jgi:hypothetical protein
MRKLLTIEQNALDVLNARGPLTPGHEPGSFPNEFIRSTLDALVKKKRAVVEMTDDGPRYTAIRSD